MPTSILPLEKSKRHLADYADDEAHVEIAATLSELPDDHPARAKYLRGEADGIIAVTHLIADRMDLVERLKDAYFAHGRRISAKAPNTSDIGKFTVEEIRSHRAKSPPA